MLGLGALLPAAGAARPDDGTVFGYDRALGGPRDLVESGDLMTVPVARIGPTAYGRRVEVQYAVHDAIIYRVAGIPNGSTDVVGHDGNRYWFEFSHLDVNGPMALILGRPGDRRLQLIECRGPVRAWADASGSLSVDYSRGTPLPSFEPALSRFLRGSGSVCISGATIFDRR